MKKVTRCFGTAWLQFDYLARSGMLECSQLDQVNPPSFAAKGSCQTDKIRAGGILLMEICLPTVFLPGDINQLIVLGQE